MQSYLFGDGSGVNPEPVQRVTRDRVGRHLSDAFIDLEKVGKCFVLKMGKTILGAYKPSYSCLHDSK
ncbi:MAG: hypothetical protein F6K40_20390 [Okeania sp. SIO3I5]|uniref:hypothetical protein n=1 Tax=Okeania sp. SIO3I5 TaxID=2607805 RepID=UPI0013BCCB6D|nr:hypothetical protein [Okeania sp. SIO3I5]NEQ38497.1 hypothetical protein [Okeania sp. SIO3I5]